MRLCITVILMLVISFLSNLAEAKGRGRGGRASVVLRPASTLANPAYVQGNASATLPTREVEPVKPKIDFFSDKTAKPANLEKDEQQIDPELAKANFEAVHARQLAAKAKSEQEDALVSRTKPLAPNRPTGRESAQACQQGLVLQSGACVQVDLPANAQLNYQGTGWDCISGYQRNADRCTKIELPANAVLNFRGDDWKCTRGLQRSGNQCI